MSPGVVRRTPDASATRAAPLAVSQQRTDAAWQPFLVVVVVVVPQT